MAFGDYVRVLRAYWRSALAVFLIGPIAAVVLIFTLPATYTASAQVLFTPNTESIDGQDIAFASTYLQSRMIAYRGLVSTPQVLGPVVSDLNLSVTPKRLGEHVTGEYEPTSTLLTIKVSDDKATEAARIVRAVASSMIDTVSDIEEQQSGTGANAGKVSTVTGKLVTDPATPTSPSSPNPKLFIVAGVMLGLILAIAQALLRWYVATSHRGDEVDEPESAVADEPAQDEAADRAAAAPDDPDDQDEPADTEVDEAAPAEGEPGATEEEGTALDDFLYAPPAPRAEKVAAPQNQKRSRRRRR